MQWGNFFYILPFFSYFCKKKDMPKRKVLFIHETMSGGGAERVFLDLLHHMDYTRYDVSLLLVYATGVYIDQIPGDVRLLYINRDKKHPLERVLFRCKPLLDRYQSRHVNRLLGDERYDTIASFMEGPAMLYHSYITWRAHRNVTWIHTDIYHNHWTVRFHGSTARERERYAMMDMVVCVSQGSNDGFERLLGKDMPHIIQPNPIDRDTIVAKAGEGAVATSRFTVCNVGRLVPEKRQERIIEAAALLRRRGVDIDFWLVGAGHLEQRLKDMAVELGVDDRVKFWGFNTNPYPILSSAHAMLLSSEAEGYPTVVCEALCLGVPVVSTRVAGVDELLGSGAGIVCDHTVEAIADAIEAFATSPQRLAQCAHEAALRGTEFDINSTIKKIEQIL